MIQCFRGGESTHGLLKHVIKYVPRSRKGEARSRWKIFKVLKHIDKSHVSTTSPGVMPRYMKNSEDVVPQQGCARSVQSSANYRLPSKGIVKYRMITFGHQHETERCTKSCKDNRSQTETKPILKHKRAHVWLAGEPCPLRCARPPSRRVIPSVAHPYPHGQTFGCFTASLTPYR
ncbi:hypothetical protein J6590_016484 [Homalodisca vitripennis]|nr:hypothetical protein J6590_016484 [Homalodisca vitripennis]